MKVRLYPTDQQKQLLAKQFGCSRFWWNKALGLQYERVNYVRSCGHKYEQLQLIEREWICEGCKTRLLRDENAAKNIRLEGIIIMGLGHSLHGDGVRLQSYSEATVCEVSTTPIA